MSSYRVARRYATALMQSAEENHELKEVARDAEIVRNTIRENRALRLVLASPVIQREKKKRILEKIFEKKTGSMMLKFLDLITEKNREGEVLDILDQFMELLDEKRGIVRVEVKSTFQLTDNQSSQLKKELAVYTGKKIVPSFRLDASLLGGFVVRLNDRIIDASLAHQLELLRDKFLEGKYAGGSS